MKPEPFGFLPGEVPAFPASPVLSARRFFALMAVNCSNRRARRVFFERLQLFIESKRKAGEGKARKRS